MKHAYKFLLREQVGFAAVLWRLRQCVSCLICYGVLAWAVATTFTVVLLLVKKWLKKRCGNLLKDDDDSTTNHNIDPSTLTTNDPTTPNTNEPSTPTTITIEPTTPTLIYDDDDDDDDDWRGMHPLTRSSHPPSPQKNESRIPLITPMSQMSTTTTSDDDDDDDDDDDVAGRTRSKRQLKF